LPHIVNHTAELETSTVDHIQALNKILEQQLQERTAELHNEIHQHKSTQTALYESEERFRTFVELSTDAIIMHSETKIISSNPTAFALFRVRSAEAMLGKSIFDFMNVHQSKLLRDSIVQMMNGSVLSVISEYIFNRTDGEEFTAEVTATKLKFQGKATIHIMIRDITERSKNKRQRIELEQQLLHVQKKEIISTLASGIAHDILNILGIIGTAINKLTYMKDLDQKSVTESAEQISKATERGRSLVRQLLTFAKKSALNFDLVPVNSVVTEMISIVQRTFPFSITIETQFSDNLPLIRADGNQIHQALLNLCLNARDAIRDSGTITISTSTEERASNKPLAVKKYICITVSDSGCGMPKEIMENIFQPFFTTKHETEGSGLGLAMVNGIMENHRGFIEVDSTVGKGTTFKLFFPV
jgi:PAS domain S-box-containing protein